MAADKKEINTQHQGDCRNKRKKKHPVAIMKRKVPHLTTVPALA